MITSVRDEKEKWGFGRWSWKDTWIGLPLLNLRMVCAVLHLLALRAKNKEEIFSVPCGISIISILVHKIYLQDNLECIFLI